MHSSGPSSPARFRVTLTLLTATFLARLCDTWNVLHTLFLIRLLPQLKLHGMQMLIKISTILLKIGVIFELSNKNLRGEITIVLL